MPSGADARKHFVSVGEKDMLDAISISFRPIVARGYKLRDVFDIEEIEDYDEEFEIAFTAEIYFDEVVYHISPDLPTSIFDSEKVTVNGEDRTVSVIKGTLELFGSMRMPKIEGVD